VNSRWVAALLLALVTAQTPDPLTAAKLLLREGKTAEARAALDKAQTNDAETWYQRSRSHLLDFYQIEDVAKRRTALALAMEAMSTALARDANHIPTLRAKAVIHARAELLYYDPNLAYELASRIAKLEPNANAYILNLTEWMSGEVRFTHDKEHRVPHDPLLGLDRSIPLLERVIDSAVPYSAEETAGFFGMGKTLSRRGDFAKAIPFFQQVLKRTQDPEQKAETFREIGTAYYRSGNYFDAAKSFYESLQWKPNPIDQWMLKTSMDQIPENGRLPLPGSVLFPEKPAIASTLEFRDIAPKLGVNRFDGNGTCGWADFDHDGDQDLFLAGSGTFIAVYRNDGSKFIEVTPDVGLANVPSGYSLNLIDYDNDGWLDLYVTLNGWSGPMPNRLYRNNKGKYEDVTAKSGAGDAGDGFVSVWGDLDNDGWIDIVIANGVLKDGSTPQVYRNNGNGTFTRATPFKEPPQWGAIGAALGDYDKDGDLDILINGLNDAPNRLYRNDGGWRFTEVTREAGVAQPPHNGYPDDFARALACCCRGAAQ
jgi:tetratricopeptide (TPR) repeat protein